MSAAAVDDANTANAPQNIPLVDVILTEVGGDDPEQEKAAATG